MSGQMYLPIKTSINSLLTHLDVSRYPKMIVLLRYIYDKHTSRIDNNNNLSTAKYLFR
jgi:hypothetical protein